MPLPPDDRGPRPPGPRTPTLLRRLFTGAVLAIVTTALVLAEHTITSSATHYAALAERALTGGSSREDLVERPDLTPVTLRSLLVSGEPDQALRLIRALPAHERVQSVHFEIAALLESGALQRARSLWETRRANAQGPFAERLHRTMLAMDRGLGAALFDRHGEALAYRGLDGGIRLADRVDSDIVPRQALMVLPEVGGARLSLDLDLSRELVSAIEGHTRRRVQGGVVVLDARDGSLLAAVTDTGGSNDLGHDYLASRREPASIAKLLTTTAVMRAGWNPDAEIRRRRCTGGIRFPKGPLYCSSVGGRLRGLDHAMASSCNVAFAALGERLGPLRLIDEYRRFGFLEAGQPTASLYGQLLADRPSPRDLGELAIGLNQVEITPLHAAVLARTMVDGVLRAPNLAVRQDGLLGLSPSFGADATSRTPLAHDGFGDPGGQQILRKEWLPALHSAMVAVADPGGTAYGIEPRGLGVAMKTGTASDPATGYHVNYIGFAPADDPQFAFALRLTHGRTSKRVRNQAKAVTREILRVLEREVERRKTELRLAPTAKEGSLFATLGGSQPAKVAPAAGAG